MASTVDRGLRSASSLLATSMSLGVQSFEKSSRIDNRSIPRTSGRVRLPMDAALSELSQSLGDASAYFGRPSSVDDAVLRQRASASPNVRRPWTSAGLNAEHSVQTPLRRRGPAARLTTEEQGIESMLQDRPSSLAQEGIDRASLHAAGLGPKQASRLYRIIYLHSCGLQDVLLSLTDSCGVGARGEVLLKVWKVFVWLGEHNTPARLHACTARAPSGWP